MTPLERYQSDLDQSGFVADPAQRAVVLRLDALARALESEPPPAPRPGLLARLVGRGAGPSQPRPRGLYIWGSVGRGKTHLVDCFHDALGFEQRRRVHFHAFMQSVHRALRELGTVEHPLRRVAEDLAREIRVLCLDEFHVSDITDAMILAGLLEALFERGITLVTTSNEPPARLYWQGLQRERFLPAIALLERELEVLHLDGPVDYRLRELERAPIYHVPADTAADEALAGAFERIAGDPGREGGSLRVEAREIPTRRQASGVVWFDFQALCGGPRGAADYIDIARCFHTVLVSGLPQLGPLQDDEAKRLVLLVDEFYDRNVKLVVSAEAAPTQLYQGQRLARAFERTASRLIEMQSHDYLARPHLSE